MILDYELGDKVLNPTNKEQGTGQVQSIINNKVTVNFENVGKKVINANLIELINVHLIKQKYNFQSKLSVKDYIIDLNSRTINTQNKKLKLGICGEHGGDPKSIEFCSKAGLDYVSCSPYRVPVARLAAAQAQLKKKLIKFYISNFKSIAGAL